MKMTYYIIATHQVHGVIRTVRYITDLEDARIIFERNINIVINDINSTMCKVYTATRKSDGAYKLGAEVIVKRNYVSTTANKKSRDNLDNLPTY